MMISHLSIRARLWEFPYDSGRRPRVATRVQHAQIVEKIAL